MLFFVLKGQDPYTQEVVNAALFNGVSKTDKRDRVDRDESAGKFGGAADTFNAENFDVRVASLFAHVNTYVNFGIGLLEFARLCTVTHTCTTSTAHFVTLQPRASSGASSALVVGPHDEGEVHNFAFVCLFSCVIGLVLELSRRAN